MTHEKDRHRGINTQRLKTNPRERKFAKLWETRNVYGRSLLAYLLDERKVHTGHPPSPSDRDCVVAATVIQWLGTPVGQGFLAELGYVEQKEVTKAQSLSDRLRQQVAVWKERAIEWKRRAIKLDPGDY
jgi:hypothetical protein